MIYKIHLGDCLTILNGIDNNSVQMVFADPPFNAGKDYGEFDDSKSDEEYLQWLKERLTACARVLDYGGTFWLMNDTRWIGHCQVMLYDLGLTFQNMIAWIYANPTPAKYRFPKTWRPILLFTKGDKPAIWCLILLRGPLQQDLCQCNIIVNSLALRLMKIMSKLGLDD